MKNIFFMFSAFLIAVILFAPMAGFTKENPSKSDTMKETVTALCSRMDACGQLGPQTKEECIAQDFITDSPYEKVPDVTRKELNACVKAINSLKCDKVKHSIEPPKECSFLKGM